MQIVGFPMRRLILLSINDNDTYVINNCLTRSRNKYSSVFHNYYSPSFSFYKTVVNHFQFGDKMIPLLFQVFKSIKDNFIIAGCHLELIPEHTYDRIVRFIDNFFLNDEPLFAALDLKIGPYTSRLLWRMRQNISIMAVANDSDEIMGVFLSGVEKKSSKPDINSLSDESLREKAIFVSQTIYLTSAVPMKCFT